MSFYSEGRIRGFVRLLAILVSSVLPIVLILALYYIPTQKARLGAIVAFCSLYSVALSLLTDAKNVEIIAVTAASVSSTLLPLHPILSELTTFSINSYAAVQVVFMSGSIPSKS